METVYTPGVDPAWQALRERLRALLGGDKPPHGSLAKVAREMKLDEGYFHALYHGTKPNPGHEKRACVEEWVNRREREAADPNLRAGITEAALDSDLSRDDAMSTAVTAGADTGVVEGPQKELFVVPSDVHRILLTAVQALTVTEVLDILPSVIHRIKTRQLGTTREGTTEGH